MLSSRGEKIGIDKSISQMAINSFNELMRSGRDPFSTNMCIRCGAIDFSLTYSLITEDADGFSCVELLCPACAGMEFEMSTRVQ